MYILKVDDFSGEGGRKGEGPSNGIGDLKYVLCKKRKIGNTSDMKLNIARILTLL